jgi:transposase
MFSNNWKKAKARIQRIHARIGDARRDYLHKVATVMANWSDRRRKNRRTLRAPEVVDT